LPEAAEDQLIGRVGVMFRAALALFQRGQLAPAEQDLRHLLALQPNHFDALHLLALIMRRQRQTGQALELLRRAVNVNANSAAAHRHLANVLVDAGALEEAIASFDRALELHPEFVEAHLGRGLTLMTLKRPQLALTSLDHVVRLRPDDAAAHGARANALLALGRAQEALECCERAERLAPALAETQVARGAALLILGRAAEALASFESAIGVRPSDVAHNGHGAALQDLQRPTDALASFDAAIALNPQFADAYNNRGITYAELENAQAAVESLQTAIRIRPQDPRAHLNLAHIYLQHGRFAEGWRLYDWRRRFDTDNAIDLTGRPTWSGQDIRGATVFIHGEQGLGDTIQFCRYIRLLEELGARVVFAPQDCLRRLLQGLSSTISLCPPGHIPRDFDYHCPLLSLPGVFGTSLQHVPAVVPYLHTEPQRVRDWRQVLPAAGFRIGICWQGGLSRIDIGRSFPVALFEHIASVPGVQLISLQKGPGADQLKNLPPGMSVLRLGDQFDQGPDAFVDSAAVMESLDLVITSDTAIAHLAGALNRHAWVVLKRVPDWRWMLGRTDTPWYPSLRLFRQKQRGEWTGVFDEMRAQLVNPPTSTG
jgi:tetratricopeptide (TPR) repeat protein